MTMLLQILIRTPVWVWALLALVLWLGWRDLHDRSIAPARLAILPAVAASTSLFNAVTASMPDVALPVWLAAIALAAGPGLLVARRRRLTIDRANRRMALSGSWFSMALGLSIFIIRYAMGVAVARDPSRAADIGWIVTASAVSGGVTGIAAGWLGGLLLRYRQGIRAHRAADTLLTTT